MAMPWDEKEVYGVRPDGTYGSMEGFEANKINKASIEGYYDDLAGLVDQSYKTAQDALKQKYSGVQRYRDAQADVQGQKMGLTGSPTMQALRDVYQAEAGKAMGADTVSLESKRIAAQIAAMQKRIDWLISEGRYEEAKKMQQEAADAAAWGNILTAAASLAGFALGGVPGLLVGGAAGSAVNAAGQLANNQYMAGAIDDAYADYAWDNADITSPYVDF